MQVVSYAGREHTAGFERRYERASVVTAKRNGRDLASG